MGAALDDPPLIQHHNAVGIADGAQTVGDDEGSPALHKGVHTLLHQCLSTGIDGGGCLIQDHHRGIGHCRPGNGDELPLTLAQPRAVAGEHGVVALRQPGDEVVGVGQLCRLDAFLLRGIQLAVTDVVHHRAGEQVGILQHHAQRAAQIRLFDLIDVDIVIADLAVGNVIEPVDQIGNGGLACAGSAYEGQLLTGMGVQGHIMQHRLFRYIAEVHVEHGDIALQLGVGQRAVAVGVLPRPVAGMLFRLGDIAVFVDLRIHQGHIAVILLRLLVQKLKDPLRAGQRHNDGVDLIAHLADGLVEGAGEQQEGYQRAGGQQLAVGGDDQQRAHNGQNGVLDIAQVVIHRAHHVGESAGLEGVVPKMVIELVKFRLTGIFVGEHLHHTLAAYHLLHIAVDCAQGLLLIDEELGGVSGHRLGDKEDSEDGQDHDGGEDGGGEEHGEEHHHDGDGGGDTLGDGLGDHLTQGVDVAGVAAHQVAHLMGVEIAHRQLLHVGEHGVTDVLLDALGHRHHQPGGQEVGQHAGQVDHRHHAQKADQRPKIGRRIPQHGGDILFDQNVQRAVAGHGGAGGEDNAHHHHDEPDLIGLHVAKQPQERLFGIFGLPAVTTHSYRRHYSSPPFTWDS